MAIAMSESQNDLMSLMYFLGNSGSQPMGPSPSYAPQQYPTSSRKSTPDNPGYTAKNFRRHYVKHNYHDHANDVPPPARQEAEEEAAREKGRNKRGGVSTPFPEKLHRILDQIAEDGLDDIIAWQGHGRSFCIHKPKKFQSEIMPKYFHQSKISSFQRQLNLYGFCRLTRGKDRGSYYHELFLRGKVFLCKGMKRTTVKGTGVKASSSPDQEPDFYSMPPVGAVKVAAKKEPVAAMPKKGASSSVVTEDGTREDLVDVAMPTFATDDIPTCLPVRDDEAAHFAANFGDMLRVASTSPQPPAAALGLAQQQHSPILASIYPALEDGLEDISIASTYQPERKRNTSVGSAVSLSEAERRDESVMNDFFEGLEAEVDAPWFQELASDDDDCLGDMLDSMMDSI